MKKQRLREVISASRNVWMEECRMFTKTRPAMFRLVAILTVVCGASARADDGDLPRLVEPVEVRRVVADGKHNAFTAMVRLHDRYWLAYRKGSSHGTRDGVIVVLSSADAKDWTEAHRVNLLPDDRDPQFLATKNRLFLYDNALNANRLTAYVTYTDDGREWSRPRDVYRSRFIIWKPVEHKGRFYATAHRKAEGSEGGKVREAHLITSTDGIDWKKVSTIRSGAWESETTIHFTGNERVTAFMRTKYSVPGHILESKPPYTEWTQRPAGVHLSGHSVYTFDGATYLLSRTITDKKTGTMIYTYEDGKLLPYCRLPSGGDCSYPTAVQMGDEMLVSYYSSHEAMKKEGKQSSHAAHVYLARVPLKRSE